MEWGWDKGGMMGMGWGYVGGYEGKEGWGGVEGGEEANWPARQRLLPWLPRWTLIGPRCVLAELYSGLGGRRKHEEKARARLRRWKLF